MPQQTIPYRNRHSTGNYFGRWITGQTEVFIRGHGAGILGQNTIGIYFALTEVQQQITIRLRI